MMNEELKPCPFCGGEGVVERFGGDFYEGWMACCSNLECDLRPASNFYETKEQAIDVWNRRV